MGRTVPTLEQGGQAEISFKKIFSNNMNHQFLICTFLFGVILSAPKESFMEMEASGDIERIELGSGDAGSGLVPRLNIEDLGSGDMEAIIKLVEDEEGSGMSGLRSRIDIEIIGSGDFEEEYEGSGEDFRAAELSDEGSSDDYAVLKLVEEMEEISEMGSGDFRIDLEEMASGMEDMDVGVKIIEDDTVEESGNEEDESVEASTEIVSQKPRNIKHSPLKKIKTALASAADDVRDAKLNLAKSVLKAKKDILEAKKGIAKHFKKKLQSS